MNLDDWRRWSPCQHPERRPDQHTSFHARCNPCAVAYAAQQYPPPLGAFTGWHDHWDPVVLESLLAGDGDAIRDALEP